MKQITSSINVVIRLQEIKKSVYDNKRDLALSQLKDMIQQIAEYEITCERCGCQLSKVDYHCGGELCEPCANANVDRAEESEAVYKKLLALNGSKVYELDNNQLIFLKDVIDVSRKLEVIIGIDDDEVINIRPFINDYLLDDKIYNDMVVQNKLNEFRNRKLRQQQDEL